jgi:hypothetical protein
MDHNSPYDGPSNPFFRELPFGTGDAEEGTRRVTSGPIQPSAVNGFFKVSLRINGHDIDPHIATAP